MAKKWYLVRTYSGYEGRVRDALAQRFKQQGLEDMLGELLVPVETVTEPTPRGGARVVRKPTMPGYVFAELELNERTWRLVKDTPRVVGFVGDRKPQEVGRSQIEELRRGMLEGVRRPRPRVSFEVGEQVRMVSGPFANFTGTVDEVNSDKQKLRIRISIFGRPTPVEVDFAAVSKLRGDEYGHPPRPLKKAG